MVMEGGNIVLVSVSSSGGDESDVVKELMEVIESVGLYSGYRKTQRKDCLSLVRRLKLLVPFLEELRELGTSVSGKALNCLDNLRKALVSAMKLLKHCNYGSKIYLVSLLSLSICLSLFVFLSFPICQVGCVFI